MNRRTKVLLLQSDFKVRAHLFSDLNEQIVRGLPRERYEVYSAFLFGKPNAGDPISQAEHSIYLNCESDRLGGLRVGAISKLFSLCRAIGFDAVICHRFKAANTMLIVSRLLQRPPFCVGISHGQREYDQVFRRIRARLLVGPNWCFVGVSQAVKDYLVRFKSAFHERNTVVIDNGIDVAEATGFLHSREDARRELGLASDRFVIGTVGRLVPVKAHKVLIEAFARLAVEMPNVDLVIIGGGREELALRIQVEEAKLGQRVHLLGKRDLALQYLRAFDIFALPSLSEGLPLALLEAMAAALPIVGSDIDAMRDLVLKAGGTVVQPGNEKHLARALGSLCRLPLNEREKLGTRARDYLLKHHDIHAYQDAYRDLIDQGVRRCLPDVNIDGT